jgi:hypothetical protein
VLPTARQNSPQNFDYDVVFEAVSRRQLLPRFKFLVEATMKIAFTINAEVGGTQIL